MEPEEYIEYVEDTILSRTPKLGKTGVLCKGLITNNIKLFLVVTSYFKDG